MNTIHVYNTYSIPNNKHILNSTHISLQVMHSQRLREKPLRPWVVAEKDGVIVSSHCDCQAGLGEVCSHVSALLFSIEAIARIRDEKTVTQKPAYWKLPAEMRKLEYNRLCEMDMSSAKTMKKKLDDKINLPTFITEPPKPKQKDLVQPTEAEMNSFYAELFRTNTKPVVLSTIEPYCSAYLPRTISEEFPKALSDLYNPTLLHAAKEDVLEHCTNISKTLVVTEEQVRNVEVATRQQSKTKLWNKFRAGRITASKARAAVKTSVTSPAQSLIRSICYPETTNFSTQATMWGCDHEDVAKKEFLEEMCPFHDNLTVEPCGFFIDSKQGFIGASPDGIVSCDCCGSSLIEIKCPYSVQNTSVHEHLNYLERTNEGRYFLKRDHPYYYQVQTQLGVTGKELCFFVVWTNKNIHVERIVFDENFYSEICSKTKILFDSVILPELVAKLTSRNRVLQPNVTLNQIPVVGEGTDKQSNVRGEENEKWCYCGEGEHGKMIACDDENCELQWFHLGCVGLTKAPRGKWYCNECKPLKRKQKKK